MPSVQCVSEPAGPTLEIGISQHQQNPMAMIPPASTVWVRAIADTGASSTCICAATASRAFLPVLGKQLMRSASTERAVNVFYGDFWIKAVVNGASLAIMRFSSMRFLELALPGNSHQALLGMDILSQGMLVVNGPTKSTTFIW